MPITNAARPVIVVAVPEGIRAAFLRDEEMSQLTRLGTVRVAHTPGDWTADDTIEDADVLVTGWGTGRVTPAVLGRAPRLKAVVHTAGTVRGVVDPACYARDGFQVSCQAAGNGHPVAHYTLAMIILGLKGAFPLREEYRRARATFRDEPHRTKRITNPRYGLSRRRIGLVSASTIGREVIELLRPYDVDVMVYDPYLTAEDATRLGVTVVSSLVELASASDVFSVHAPWLPTTEGLISAEVIAALPDGCTFINTARGMVVDEPALIDELKTGRFQAILDVTITEPPVADSPLWELENVFLTPHVAGSMGTELSDLGAGAVAEVERVLAGKPLVFPVTREGYERQA